MLDHEAQTDHVTENAHFELGYVGPTKAYCQKGPAAIHGKMQMVYPRSSLFKIREHY